MKSELISNINDIDEKLDGVEKCLGERIDQLDKKMDGVEERLTERIDKIGLQVARLEDDTPTRDEFDNLVKRVSMLETKAVTN